MVPEASAIISGGDEFARRDFTNLVLAALGGLLAGAVILHDHGKNRVRVALRDASVKDKDAGSTGVRDTTETGEVRRSDQGETQERDHLQADEQLDPNLLAQEPHVCRGLNTCRGKGKGGENDCAGRGDCAVVMSHACQGLNDCEGRGGCGEYPGQDRCKGQGGSAVPLKKDTWKKARARFEQVMASLNKDVRPPPENCPKG